MRLTNHNVFATRWSLLHLLSWLPVLCYGLVEAQTKTGYIEYIPGNMSLILTSPHGGLLRPDNIRSRDAACWDPANQTCVPVHDCEALGLREDYHRCGVVIGWDGMTNNVTLWMSDVIYDVTGRRPHVINNYLYRSKVDLNRPRARAAFGDPTAEAVWEEWHRSINQSKSSIGGAGLLLDLHGHDHPERNVELGYLISGQKLDDLDSDLDPNTSSIRDLASRSNTSFEELLRGVNSLGTILSAEGYRTVPSGGHPGPGGAPYFFGGTRGTNTATHGSRDGGQIDAIQVETPAFIIIDANRTRLYAGALARSVVRFHSMHYGPVEEQGLGAAAITETTLCARPNFKPGLFFSCVLCPGDHPSQTVHCGRKKWKRTFYFNEQK